MQLVVGPSGSQVKFVGTNYSGEAATPQLCNYALGILDKETRELKMVPITANRIFRLEPKFGALDFPDNETRDVVHDESRDEVDEESQDEVKEEKDLTPYLSKKVIRQIKKRKELIDTGLSGSQTDYDEKIKGIKANTEALEAVASTTNALNIPPYNLDAASPDTAYPLEKIILNGDWDYLLDIFELVQAGSEVRPDVYPIFVCNRIHKLKDIKDESRKRTMAGILSYITHMIKYKDKHSVDGVSSAKGHKLPGIFAQRFASMFGTT